MKTEKVCCSCQAERPTAEFWKSSNNRDGFRSRCIPCEMKYRHNRRDLDRKASRDGQRRRREAQKAKMLEEQRKWAEANPEKVLEAERVRRETLIQKKLEQSSKWRREQPEKVRESQRKYRESHPEIYREATKKYYKANPEVKRSLERRRKARKHDNATFKITTRDLKKLYAGPCSYCGSFESMTLDHVIPISKGGVHGVGNLVPACGPCNFSKGQKLLIEWKLYKKRKGKK